jgi:hypothetical protein
MHDARLLEKSHKGFILPTIVRVYTFFFFCIKLIFYLKFELLENWESLVLCL